MRYHHLMHRAAAQLAAAANDRAAIDRRVFLKLGAASGFALGAFPVLGADKPATDAALKPQQLPSAFLRIDRSGLITVQVNRLEFGQGVHTALPIMLAEELDADWTKVRAELAPAGDAYKDVNYGIQMVGGSSSVPNSFQQYRELGARARAMLVAAGAQKLGVKPSDCTVKDGVISAGGKRVSYGEVAAAAMKQPVPQTVSLKDPKDFRLIGKPTPRLDARAKSTGQQHFGIDARAPGMKTVLIAHPPVFGAQVASFDAAPARAVKGVREVFKVPLDRGASGIAIVADGYWPAKKGRDALQVRWDTSAVEKVDSERQLAVYRELAGRPGLKVSEADTSKIASAPKRISAEFTFPYLAHAPMEPLNCLIELHADGCTVSAGSQFQTIDQATIAAVLGLKPEQVRFNTMMAGGGFGRRAVPTSDYLAEAAQVAKAWRAAGHKEPLKVVWSREDDIRGGYYRPVHLHRVEIGYDDKGQVLGWKHVVVGQSIVSGTPFESMLVKNGIDETMTEGLADAPYGLPMQLEVHHPKLNVPVLWWRSVGHTHTAFVMETLIDEIARGAGQDPVAYRRALLGDKHPRISGALDLAVAKSGYGTRKLPEGRAWGVAVHESFNSAVAYVVEASLQDDRPTLHKVTAGVHCNTPVNPMTIEAQVQGAALMGLGTTLPGAAITLKDGVVQQSNFSDYTVARLPDMPSVEVHIVPSTDPPTGMGEPGLPPIAPAFANALSVLTGKALRELPFKVEAKAV